MTQERLEQMERIHRKLGYLWIRMPNLSFMELIQLINDGYNSDEEIELCIEKRLNG